MIEIPCGQCINCRLQRSKEWSIRLMYELPKHNYGYFITLTYNDENLPANNSLQKKDIQDFLKRWRNKGYRYHVDGLKYYYCGEYGSADNTERPHYHMIAFMDNPIPDLKLHSYNFGNPLYKSNYLSNRWGKGFVSIGEVTQESRQYVAGYINKKLLGKGASIYDEKGILPPYTESSNGLSKLTPEEIEKIYEYDIVYRMGKNQIKSFKPPKNFDNQLDELNPQWLIDIKENRKNNRILDREAALMGTTLSEKEYRKTKAINFDAKFKNERNKII